jgi:hypothetical protein
MRDFFSHALLGAALIPMAFAQLGTGLLCVDEDVIEIFDAINKVRTDLLISQVYLNLLADVSDYTAFNNYWLYDDGVSGQMLVGEEASLTDTKSAIEAVGSAMPALIWSEGLMLACDDNAAEYVTLN